MKPARLRTAKAIAAEIFASNKRMENQRHEVTRAFLEKHGFEPDMCKQVRRKGEWCLVRMEPDEIIRIRRELIERIFYATQPTKWQRFCLWMAGLK